MITTVWAFIFVAPLTHILASDILLVPEHSLGGLSYEYRDSSIISGAQLSAELDYVDFTAEQPISLDPEGATYFCTDCPCAVVDDSSDKGYRWISDASNTLDLLWSVENNVLNLNHHALLDNEMNDLHLPQTTRQTNVVEDTGVSSDTYTGELPIKYSVKVVQTTTVEWEDASILNSAGVQQGDVVQFYSVDFEILKIDDQDFHDLDIRKINVHVVRREDGVVGLLFPNMMLPTPRNAEYFSNVSNLYAARQTSIYGRYR